MMRKVPLGRLGIVKTCLWLVLACAQPVPPYTRGLSDLTGRALRMPDSLPVAGVQVEVYPLGRKVYADSEGVFWLTELPPHDYRLRAWVLGEGGDLTYWSRSYPVTLPPGTTLVLPEPLFLYPATLDTSGLKLNEIFYACFEPGYVEDQFVEIYNPTSDTLYLDGLLIGRGMPDSIVSAFQFPGVWGRTRNFPLPPHTSVVVAQDARPHPFLDLSHAAFEFYHPHEYDPYDNPNAVNLQARIENPTGGITDLIFNLRSDVVLLMTPEGFEVYDYTDPHGIPKRRGRIPLTSILDGVQYDPSGAPPPGRDLDDRVDAGVAGAGILPYSGLSTERRLPGWDTNRSDRDFRTQELPTPTVP